MTREFKQTVEEINIMWLHYVEEVNIKCPNCFQQDLTWFLLVTVSLYYVK